TDALFKNRCACLSRLPGSRWPPAGNSGAAAPGRCRNRRARPAGAPASSRGRAGQPLPDGAPGPGMAARALSSRPQPAADRLVRPQDGHTTYVMVMRYVHLDKGDLTAALTLAGYRVTNRMGHHRVAVDAARQLLGEDALMSRIGALRRMRDRGMYEMEPPEA